MGTSYKKLQILLDSHIQFLETYFKELKEEIPVWKNINTEQHYSYLNLYKLAYHKGKGDPVMAAKW